MSDLLTPEPKLLSVRSAASFLGVSPATIRLWAQKGRLHGVKIGSRGDWRFTKKELSKMVRTHSDEIIKSDDRLTNQPHTHFELIFKHVADGITVQEPNGQLLFANDAAAKLLGFSSAKTLLATSVGDIIGKFDMLDETGNPFPIESLPGRQAILGAKPKQVIIRFRIRKTGEERWSIVNATAVTSQNKILYAINVFRDITEYQKVKEQIRQSEERYRQFLRLTSEGIWRFELEKPLRITLPVKKQIDHMYRYAYLAECNDSLAGMYGYTKAEEIIGARLGDMLIRTDKQNIDYLTAFITSGYNLNEIESHELDKNGRDVYFSNSLTGIVQDGYLLRAWGIQRDTSEKRAAQKAIQESETRFKTLTSFAPVGIFQTDEKGNCLYVNKRWCDFAGMTAEQAKGNGWLKALHPDDKDRVFQEWYEAAKARKEFSSEYRFKSAKGKITWLYGNAVALTDTEGGIIGYMGTVSDITERKETHETLQSLNRTLNKEVSTLHTFFDVLPVGVAITTDPECRYVRVNQRHAQMLGIASDQNASFNAYPSGKAPWKTIRDGREITNDERILEMTIKNNKSYSDISQSYFLKDGRKIDVLVYSAPLRENSTVTGAIGAYLDVTKLRELERQKDDFLGIASHELKTPVTSLKAYGQVLQQVCTKIGDVRSKELLQKMDAQIDKLTSLIGDLLDVTKIEGGKLQFHTERFAFDALVAEVIEAVQLTTHKHKIDRIGVTNRHIYADRERVGQVITNLLTNAIKYSPDAKRVVVRSSARNGAVKLAVQDFGIGIPKKRQEKIFSRFYRGSDRKTATFPGLGLGLYISSEIVKRLHGDIRFESQEKKGTTFSITLPVKNGTTVTDKRPDMKKTNR
jgi:PAS domain S-box-containing protein/excisionase family DNA binding protein